MITEHETTVRGAKIHWLEAGSEDPPFVLIHGFGASTSKWLDVMPLLGSDRRTIALDLPGFGTSDAPRGSYRPGWLAGAVRAFLDEIDVARAIWVGNSLGGLIAIHAAAAWPERVEALVGVDAALPNDGGRPTPRMLANYVAPALPLIGEALYRMYVRRPAAAVVRESLERNCADPSRISAPTMEALTREADNRRRRSDQAPAVVRSNRAMLWALSGRRERTWDVLRRVQSPTLFIWGERDRLVPVTVGERAVKELPGSQLIVIDDCGHNPQMECPDDFAPPVIAFARSLASSSPGTRAPSG